MLTGCLRLAVLSSGLIALAPCLAADAGKLQQRGKSAGDMDEGSIEGASGSGARHATDAVVLSGIPSSGRRSTRSFPALPREHPGAGEPLLGIDGLPVPTRGMVGRLPLEGVDVGLGLFSVTGATLKERELKRTDPMRDVLPRRSRVAGAGLRVNF